MAEVLVTGWCEMCPGDVEAVCNMSCSDAVVELEVVAASMWVPTLLGLHDAHLQTAKHLCSSVGHWQTCSETWQVQIDAFTQGVTESQSQEIITMFNKKASAIGQSPRKE